MLASNPAFAAAVAVCPACGCAEHQQVGVPATGFPIGAEGITHPSYAIHECGACGLYYKSHALSQASLEHYYAKLDSTPFDGDHGFPTDAALLAALQHVPEGNRVLDYGCSVGRLLGALGPGWQRFGVEINEAAASEARKRGITIIADAAIDTPVTEPFAVILLTDVFEHLHMPTDTLRRLAAKLAPGGQLIVVTALADAVKPRALLAEHWYFRIGGHLQMASRRHLDWLAHELGLKMVSAEVMSHYRRVPLLHARQQFQRRLYEAVRLAPKSAAAAIIARVPGIRKSRGWTNLPSTDQSADHVVAVMRRVET